MNKDVIVLAEGVLDLYKKKCAGQSISDEELNQVVGRFTELLKAQL